MLRNIIVKQDRTADVLLCQSYWQRLLNVDVASYFRVAKQATTEIKLRNLHFRVIHNIYPTNLLLHRMKIKSSPLCNFCNELDHIAHMFFFCPQLKQFWEMISSLINIILTDKVYIKPEEALLGILRDDSKCSKKKIKEANYLLLLARFTIIKFKINPNININYIFRFELGLRKKFFSSLDVQF